MQPDQIHNMAKAIVSAMTTEQLQTFNRSQFVATATRLLPGYSEPVALIECVDALVTIARKSINSQSKAA